MKDFRLLWVLLVAVSMVVSGCAKKSDQQSSIAGSGFDSATGLPMTTTEELAQLPQVGAVAQQSAVEALPIEAAPVSQAALTSAPLAVPTGTLTHEQEIQTALKNLGLYAGKIDGKLGPASKRAVEAFQKQSGLKVDGKVGPKTWAALSVYLNPDMAAAQTPEIPVSQ